MYASPIFFHALAFSGPGHLLHRRYCDVIAAKFLPHERMDLGAQGSSQGEWKYITLHEDARRHTGQPAKYAKITECNVHCIVSARRNLLLLAAKT